MVDWIALLVALVSIWVTVREVHRNNAVCLKIDECSAQYSRSIHENNCQPFSQFRVRIRNQGIPLYRVFATISYRGRDGSGTISVSLRRIALEGDRDEFSKGMIAEFAFKSHEMKPEDKAFLSSLESLRKQNARLDIYSQNYLCASFPIADRTARMKSRWNAFANKLNFLLRRRVGKSDAGHDIIHIPQILPVFKAELDKLATFIEWTRNDLGRSRSPQQMSEKAALPDPFQSQQL